MSEEKRLSINQAVLARCHRCMGYYEDGHIDCEIVACPLYAWMPYRKKEPNLDWQQYSPRGTGLRPRKPVSAERRAESARRIREYNASKHSTVGEHA